MPNATALSAVAVATLPIATADRAVAEDPPPSAMLSPPVDVAFPPIAIECCFSAVV